MIYYSDKFTNENGELLPVNVWRGIFAYLSRSIENGALGYSFPLNCPDGNFVYGTDSDLLNSAINAHIPSMVLPLNADTQPDLLQVFDLIEFLHANIAKPQVISRHGYFNHNHYSFDKEEGQHEFEEEINTIFRRNNVRYEITSDGSIVRTITENFDRLLESSINTGDRTLDSLLRDAKIKFLNPDIEERKIGIEKIWDAWERIKSLENPANKSESTKQILDKAATEQTYRQVLEDDARKLTSLGNSFRIRHSEVGKVEIERESQIDYFFYRMYSLISILLRERA